MRPSSRQRLAAWLLALPSERGGECAYRGRLEMISFWLLCWKLLRATTGLRRPTAELTDGNHDNSNSDNSDPVNDCPTPLQPTDSVTMEITSSAPLTDLGVDDLVSWHTQEEQQLCYPDIHGMHQPMREEEEAGNGDGKTDGDECDYLVFDIGERKGGVDVDESKGGTKKGVEEEEGGGRGGRDKEDGEGGKLEVEHGSKGDTESGEWYRRETEGGVEIKDEDEGVGETEEERRVGDINDDPLAEFLFSGSPASLSSSEPMNYTHMSNRAWAHDHGNRDDLSDGQLSDCLQAELAMVYSDSDAGEDQIASFVPCNATNQEEAGGGSHNSLNEVGRRAEMEEEDEVKVEIAGQREEEGEKEERSGGMDGFDDDEEQMGSGRDLFLQSPSASSTASSTDADKKVPQDFSIHQDTLSENVSTEHLDFLLARQQWRKMEEEVKGQPIPKPGLRTQWSFRGTHTSLYPPTRSPRLKHRELHQSTPQEPPLSSTQSPSSEDSGLDDPSYRGPPEEPESAVEREIRLTLEREERHRRERGLIAQGLPMTRPSSLQTGRSPPRPPACRTPTLSISPSPSCSSSLPRSAYHEMTANNVIILEPECSGSSSRNRLISTAIGGLSDWPSSLDTAPSGNVIVVETSNLIIRSASEFCLSSAPVSMETQESTFSSNPFFKLRSLSSQSLVEREIRMVRQREEEWRRQREGQWRRGREEEWKKGRERYDTVLVSPGLNDNITFSVPEVPDRCVSSPSSPSRTRKIERSSLSCDHKNTMAQRWEASLLANQKKE